jgi:hypothetical protein
VKAASFKLSSKKGQALSISIILSVFVRCYFETKTLFSLWGIAVG